jgi:hypothetical protein
MLFHEHLCHYKFHWENIFTKDLPVSNEPFSDRFLFPFLMTHLVFETTTTFVSN